MELGNHSTLLEDLDSQVVGISMDDLSEAKKLIRRTGLSLPVLYDPEAKVVRQYGVYNLLGDNLATPAVFVIDKDGVIQWKYVGKGNYDRPSAAQVLDQLRLLEG